MTPEGTERSDDRPTQAPEGARDVLGRVDQLETKLDAVASATAEIAKSQQALEAQLRALTHAVTDLSHQSAQAQVRTEDRLGTLHDAVAAPAEDLHAILVARMERAETQVSEMVARVLAILEAGGGTTAATSAAVPESDADLGDDLVQRLAAAVDRLEGAAPVPAASRGRFDWRADDLPGELPEEDLVSADEAHEAAEAAGLVARLDALDDLVGEVADRLPALADSVAHVEQVVTGGARQDLVPAAVDDLRKHTDAAVAAALRVLDGRFDAIRQTIERAAADAGPSGGSGMGFEAGAIMGTVQAAWSRLEQQLDREFDELGRRLDRLEQLVDTAVATTEEVAQRPVVTGDQLKRTASSLKDTLVAAGRAGRQRWSARRSGSTPPQLGPGRSGPSQDA